MVDLDDFTVRSYLVDRPSFLNKTNERLFDRCSIDNLESKQRADSNNDDDGSDQLVYHRRDQQESHLDFIRNEYQNLPSEMVQIYTI